MPRELVVGNGQMLIGFDGQLNMRDLYYPYVGQQNHIGGHKNRWGVWVSGRFSWCDSEGWERELSYQKDTLVTRVVAANRLLGLQLTINDTVHHHENIYLKKTVIENLHPQEREVRIFFTQDFSLYESDVGDTALYDPDLEAIYHYKRHCYILVKGTAGGTGIFQYSTGTKRFFGVEGMWREGTWRDAEDGALAGNPIAQGSVDSAISFSLVLPPAGKGTVYYWLALGRNFREALRLNSVVEAEKPERLIEKIGAYWNIWVNKQVIDFGDLAPALVDLYKRSLLILRTQVDRRGAIVAANDTDIMQYNRDHYSYVWPRDGALVAYTLIKAGYSEMARMFFRFCENALTAGGYLLHKYNPDGSLGSSWHPWVKDGQPQLPIQEDETGLVLWALWEYFNETRDTEYIQDLYGSLIRPAADFLAEYIYPQWGLPRESYDLWEERRGIFSFTAATVWAGLTAASRFAQMLADDERAQAYHRIAARMLSGMRKHLYDPGVGRFVRGVYVRPDGKLEKDLTLESSVFGLFAFGAFPADDPMVAGTMQEVARGLWVKTGVGGIARYSNDYYFQRSKDLGNVPGNPWVICTLWVAQWYIAKAKARADLKPALELLQWVAGKATRSGVLSEQYHPYGGEALSVSPLTWSHSTYVLTVLEYLEKWQELSAGLL